MGLVTQNKSPILNQPRGLLVQKHNVLVQAVVQSAGGSYQGYAKGILGIEDFDCLAESVDLDKLGENGLLFYPHLTGDKTIYADPDLRGAFIGLDTNHTREDLAVAVMEKRELP